MFARIYSGGLLGVDAYKIEVEVDCSSGIGQIQIVGLPDAAVKESQERVRAAIKACSFLMPPGKKWVVNLAPADLRKEGPAYDLPIAVGILAATDRVPCQHLSRFWFLGELGLDGALRPVTGVLPVALAAKEAGAEGIIVPFANADEASLVDGLKVFPASHLLEVCRVLENPKIATSLRLSPREAFRRLKSFPSCDLDFKEVKGQEHAKRALAIAAAGRHNLLMVGPPGSGKSMLAQRLPGIMPPLSFDEALELTKLYSIAGLVADKSSLVLERPFRAPHHSASSIGLTGGGAYPRPGEISLSHHGVLFLDELTEFPRAHLDNLRQPLETASIVISRAQQTITYPASFLLVAACNPCPCGYRGDNIKYCVCTPAQADRYWNRLSGPLLDRIDLHVEVARVREHELASEKTGESTSDIRLRVLRAVQHQKERFGMESFLFNGQLTHRYLQRFCQIDEKSRQLLARAVSSLGLSARAYDRILRIARTVADLEDSEDISADHIAEAIRYRSLCRAS
ncbi:MAG TPA: YifB family Mg chelatase-like AAA ATPase [Candidatus Obscuribacterales bacterium]